MKSKIKNINIFLIIPSCIFVIAPLASIIPLAFSNNSYFRIDGFTFNWILDVIQNKSWLSSFQTSILLAFSTGLLAITISLLTSAYLINRSNVLRNLILKISILPLLTPIVVLASALHIYFSNIGFLDNLISLILANTILSLPIAFLIIFFSLVKFKSLNPNIESASQLMGASSIYTFTRVLLPNLKVSIINAFALVFFTAFNESVISQFLCNTNTIVLSKKIFEGMRYEINPEITAVSFLLILSTLIFSFFFIFINHYFKSEIKYGN